MSKKYIDVEISVDDALSKIQDATSLEYIVDHFGVDEVAKHIDITTFFYQFGEGEILSHISDSAIEEEFYSRTPLGRAMNE